MITLSQPKICVDSHNSKSQFSTLKGNFYFQEIFGNNFVCIETLLKIFLLLSQANIWEEVHMTKIVPALLFNIESNTEM